MIPDMTVTVAVYRILFGHTDVIMPEMREEEEEEEVVMRKTTSLHPAGERAEIFIFLFMQTKAVDLCRNRLPLFPSSPDVQL